MEVIDCTQIPGTSRFCDPDSEKVLSKLIAGRFSGIHFIDSGNYHYLTRLFTDSIPCPFDLLLLDHHPDMQEPAFGNVLSCGGWARDAFTNIPNLTQVLLVGIDPDLEVEILDLVFDGVLAVTAEDLKHTGDNLAQDVLEMFSLLDPHMPVYVSIDKDVLTKDYARTDWDQGGMTLPQLEAAVLRIAAGHRLLGADICGGLTPDKGGKGEDFDINLKTDLALEKLFGNLIIDS